jgi:hypothetical protein
MMQIDGQFLITEEEKVELGKILSVKAADKDYLPASVLPLLLVGILLILLLHPLCSLLFLAPAAWQTACNSRKDPYAAVTVCTAASTYMVNVSDSGQIKELEAAICKTKCGGKT